MFQNYLNQPCKCADGISEFTITITLLISVAVFDCPACVADDVEYSRDVRSILADNCFSCHGSDDSHREANLRLDTFEGATELRDDHAAVIPGKPDASQLIARITSDNPDLKMPPTDSGKSLKSEEVELLRRWIAQGAEYQKHWAFIAPQRPDVPEIDDDWIINPIDAFIIQRLAADGLSPSPPASVTVAFRRLSLDLIGLPPSLSELDEFESHLRADSFAIAWQAQIDRLLRSPHFGEKWGRHWLDAARYADSDGFEKAKPRFVWFYPDWVVKAMNDDLPYDQFLIEQLAGDLLPNHTQDQLVATGFLRNSMINEEGGVDPEQFRMEAMFDRVDAIGKSMLGLTIQCAQCHNHKYDPLSQAEYYGIFAFLNNCDEAQATVYTDEQLQHRKRILVEVDKLETTAFHSFPDIRDRLRIWLSEQRSEQIDWDIIRPELDSSGGQKHYLLEDGSVLAQGYAPTKHTTEFTSDTKLSSLSGFRLELLNDGNLPHGGPGRSVDGLSALTEFQVKVRPLGSNGDVDAGRAEITVKLVRALSDVNPPERELASLYNDKSKKRRVTGPIEFAIDGDNLTAWGQNIGGGRSNVPREAVFIPEMPIENKHGFRVTFRLVQMHGGWNSDDNQNNNLGRFRLSVTDALNPTINPLPVTFREARQSDQGSLSDQDYLRLFSAWRLTQPEFAQLNQQIESIWQSHPQGTTQLVLRERMELRPTYLLTRGDFLKPAEQVNPGVPEWLNQLPESAGSDRLAFARWITDRKSPTTARAIVNRIWQEYFGQGIVQTVEDLGTQSSYPSHPELLDWLAVELMDNGWSLKHIHRLIVSSATYQQSSMATPETHARDPENRLLARGPRFRASGEVIRDIALAASGLLNTKIGGPGVYPPAPEFLFQPPVSYGPKTWNLETGEERYRRALYTFRFRSVPYPVLENFDTPRGDTACVRRNRSNTPLQALTTLNEELFVDCARLLALKSVSLAATFESRGDVAIINQMMRRCVGREARADESEALLSFLNQQRDRFSSLNQAQAWQLAAIDPASPPQIPSSVTPQELAAWTAVARVILNLDETITKE